MTSSREVGEELLAAVSRGSDSVVEHILQVEDTGRSTIGKTAFEEAFKAACESGTPGTVKLLLKFYKGRITQALLGEVFDQAAELNKVAIVQEILKESRLQVGNRILEMAVVRAVEQGNLSIAHLILAYARARRIQLAIDLYGPMKTAARFGYLDIIRKLLRSETVKNILGFDGFYGCIAAANGAGQVAAAAMLRWLQKVLGHIMREEIESVRELVQGCDQEDDLVIAAKVAGLRGTEPILELILDRLVELDVYLTRDTLAPTAAGTAAVWDAYLRWSTIRKVWIGLVVRAPRAVPPGMDFGLFEAKKRARGEGFGKRECDH
jgi:hypothetical protein